MVLLCNRRDSYAVDTSDICRVYFLNSSFAEVRKIFQCYHFNTF